MLFRSGMGLWMPSFIVRSYGMSGGEVAMTFGTIFGVGMLSGAALNTVVPHARATAQATANFLYASISFSLGTVSVGVLSDTLEPLYGSDSLRWALVIAQTFAGFAALAHLIALRIERNEMLHGSGVRAP